MQLKLLIYIPKTPIIQKTNDRIVDTLRPFVSDIRFITMRPAKDPKENIDWMVSRAHYKSQYKLSYDVMVNWSTLFFDKKYLKSSHFFYKPVFIDILYDCHDHN